MIHFGFRRWFDCDWIDDDDIFLFVLLRSSSPHALPSTYVCYYIMVSYQQQQPQTPTNNNRPRRTIHIMLTVAVIIHLLSRPIAMAHLLHRHILITMPRPNQMPESIITMSSIMHPRWYLVTHSSHHSTSNISRRRPITNNTFHLPRSQLPVMDISLRELYLVTIAFRRRSICHSHRWKRSKITSFLHRLRKRLRRFARRKNYSREEVRIRMPPQWPAAQVVVIIAKSRCSTPFPIQIVTTIITIESNRLSVTSSQRLHYSMIQISFTKMMVMYRLRNRMALQTASIHTKILCQVLAFVGA